MRRTIRYALAPFAIAAMFSAGWLAHAQAPVVPFPGPQAQPPTVLSGPDIGFRVDGRKNGVPVGRIVVREDGRWVEPEYQLRSRPLTD